MMTHRALVHEYVSCVVALDLTEDDRPLHCMPLYHSAQMHVFLLPSLMVGATSALLTRPDVPEIMRRVEADALTTLFLAPTVWVPLANHDDLATRDLSSLRKAYYGASIMPVPVLKRLQDRLPELGFYNCFGMSEIAPLATVLRPEEHAERPESCGRPVTFVEIDVVDEAGDAGRPRHARRAALPLAAAVHRLLGRRGRHRGGVPRRVVPLRRHGGARRGRLHHRGRPHQGRHQHRGSAGGQPRGRGRALHPPRRRRGRRHRHPGRAVDRGGDRGRRTP